MAALMLHVLLNFYTKCSKNGSSTSANTYEKYIASRDHCIARHDDKMCFLPICRFHIKLMGGTKKFLPWMHSVSTINKWIFCKQFSSTNSVVKLLSRFENSSIRCRGQFISTAQTEERTECTLWRKRTKNTRWAPSKTLNRRELVIHSLKTELNKLKRQNSTWGW